MTVEFVYWGSSELLERLTKPEHVGRVRFWFDETRFDDNWFVQRLEEARQTAGPRYTPEVHVDLPIAGRFEAFGRTSRFFDRVISAVRGLANEWVLACSSGPSRLDKEGDPEVEAGIRVVSDDTVIRANKVSIGEGIDEIVAAGSAIEVKPSGTLPFEGVAEKVAADRSRRRRRCTAPPNTPNGTSGNLPVPAPVRDVRGETPQSPRGALGGPTLGRGSGDDRPWPGGDRQDASAMRCRPPPAW